jgi:hypothetical protein
MSEKSRHDPRISEAEGKFGSWSYFSTSIVDSSKVWQDRNHGRPTGRT